MQAFILLAFVAVAAASHAIHSFDECYREGDIVLDPHNRCKYSTCEKKEPEHGYAHFELKENECAEGTGVPYFLMQQYLHGVYAGHRFIGSHLASTVCSDKHVKDCTAHYGYGHGYGHGLGHQGHLGGHHGGHGYAPYGYAAPAYPVKAEKKADA